MPVASRKTPIKRSSKTPRVARSAKKASKEDSRLPPPDDYEDTEDEDWVQDLREYLKNRLQNQLDGDTTMDERRRELLTSVVQGYRSGLQRGRFDKHTRGDAWESVLELYRRHLRDGTVYDPNDSSDLPSPPIQPKPKRKRKMKRGGSGRVAKFLGTPIPKSPQRTRVINLVSKWVRDYGIKPKSKYILKMDIILGDALRPDDWNKEGLRSQDIANNIIQEFQDRYPDYMRVLKKRRKEPVERRKPVWSEATLAKREATKEKRDARARRKALYEQYKLLPKGRMKKDFNIQHGRYGSGIRRKKPRYTKEEIDSWEDATKRDNYRANRRTRKDLKGLTRQGRLAYFKTLRANWSPEQLADWKASWKAKSAGWKRKRGVEDPPKRQKIQSKKSQGLPIDVADEGGPAKRTRSRKGGDVSIEDDAGTQLLHV